MQTHMKDTNSTANFNGVRIDTGANRASVISTAQYKAHCDTFGIFPVMRIPNDRKVTVIGGTQKEKG